MEEKENDKKPETMSDEKETVKAENIKEQADTQKKTEEKTVEDKNVGEKPVEQSEEADVEGDEKESKEKIQPAAEMKKEKVKTEVKKDKTGKKTGHKEDFKYIVRIANTDINGEKTVVYGLSTIKGIGLHLATVITDIVGIDRNKKIGDLDDKDIERLQQTIDSISENTPSWLLNHRKDYETGEDKHFIGSDIDMKLRDEINIMKKIRCYRGIRHERGLPVRGQRTRSNNRKGLALGVSRKRT